MRSSMVWWLISYFYKRFSWLSLDVVLGAIISHRMAAQLPDGRGATSWATTAVLAIIVWGIYVIDRRIDNTQRQPTTNRHLFQAQQQPVLSKILIGSAVVAAICLFWLPATVLKIGLGLAIVVIVYLWGVYRSQSEGLFETLKDIVVPLVYAVGVWATATVLQSTMSITSLLLGIVFWLIVQQNLLLSAYYESFTVDKSHSLAIVLGEHATRFVLTALFVCISILCIYTMTTTPHHYATRVAFWLWVMGILQHLLWQKPELFLANDTYRYLAEATFLIPILAV
jgi:hypothetical protein